MSLDERASSTIDHMTAMQPEPSETPTPPTTEPAPPGSATAAPEAVKGSQPAEPPKERSTAPLALAAIVAAEGVAHLVDRRVFHSLVPQRLYPFRREFNFATGLLQLAGATALAVPKLRTTGRWINAPLEAVTIIAALDTALHPGRPRRQHDHSPGVESLLDKVRVPPHVAMIVSIWLATRATERTGGTPDLNLARAVPPRLRRAAAS
jgi:uncharacterized membrane protein